MQRFEKWTEIYLQLLKADQENELEPRDLETLGLAAFMTGREAEGFQILDRAHQGYLNRTNTDQAARCAFWLGLMLMNSGQRAKASGWMARAERILNNEQIQDCAMKGLLLIPAALETLSKGEALKALALFEEAATIGERFGDTDLIVLGHLGQGQALIDKGDVANGIKLLDEMMISVETEKVFPVVCGIVYCAVIETCRKVWDIRRAQEWTSSFTRWCDAQPDIVPIKGQCLVRRAEIIQFHGDLNKALEEARDACDLLTRPPGEPAAGEAYYRKGELHRLLGDFEDAEDSYRDAAKWGRNPQPGLALLRFAQGQNDAARTSIINTLEQTKNRIGRAELLPTVVTVMLALKQPEQALTASKELCEIANEIDTPYLYGMSAYCQGAVFLGLGNIQLALEHLQQALKLWNALYLPYETARTRELNAIVYRELNDNDNSDVELAAARWIFEQLHAAPDLERISQLLKKKRDHQVHGLTLRELQIVRLVASGKTNKSIASELFISERTVDRHVSNIFNKLGVSSRVAVTAFAFKNELMHN